MGGLSSICVAVGVWQFGKGNKDAMVNCLVAAVALIAGLFYVLWLIRWPPLMVLLS
jgi:hypothetical protein